MKLLPCIIALLAGIGIGIGAGIMMTKPKVEENKTRIAELEAAANTLQEQNAALKKSKADSEQAIRKASIEIARYKNDLSRTTDMIRGLSTDLQKANAELARLQGPAPAETTSGTSTPIPATAAGTAASPMVATTDYVVKDGDSLWKIAATQLDNGMRYKEILALNPTLSEDKPLVVGTKIKLPSQ
jgi:LysM repeat protein